MLVVGRLERGRHGGVGGGDGVRVLGNLGFHVRGGGRGGGEGAEAAAAAAVGRERDAPRGGGWGGGRTATEAEVCAKNCERDTVPWVFPSRENCICTIV